MFLGVMDFHTDTVSEINLSSNALRLKQMFCVTTLIINLDIEFDVQWTGEAESNKVSAKKYHFKNTEISIFSG